MLFRSMKTKNSTRNKMRNHKLVSQASRPLGNHIISPMAYSTRRTIDPGALGSAANTVFDLSSVQDPDYTGVGHQPVGHDQLSTFFERYQVISVDYQIVFFNSSEVNFQRVGIRAVDVPVTDTDPDVLVENGNSQWTLLSPYNGSQSIATFSGSIELNEVHGITKAQYLANDDYGASFGSNPSERAFLHLWADGLGTDTAAVGVAVKLVYHTRCMGSVNIPLS